MRRIHSLCLFALLALVFSGPALGQNYPTTNPTFIGTATLPPQSLGAAGTVVFQVNGQGAMSMALSGTGSGIAATIQGTTQRTGTPVWITLPVAPAGGGASALSISATGTYLFDASGFAQVRLNLTAVTGSVAAAFAGTPGPSASVDLGGDVCQNTHVLKSSVAVNQGSSATTKVVDAVAGQTVYVCGVVFSSVGTNPTSTFKTGTHASADCDTAAASLTGAVVPSATDSMVNLTAPGTIMKSIVSGQICITTGATTSDQGVLTYVQR